MYEDYDEADDLEVIQEGGVEEVAENSDHNDEDDENAGEQAEEASDADATKKEVKPKRIVKNPQPKLNFEALKGKRGLTALEGYFQNVKFKGKDHEEEDLRKIMKTYEYWCHRLFPKFSFDDCIARLEKLGTKKNVQTYVKKIRLNMLVDDIEPVLNNSDDEDMENNTQQTAYNEFDNVARQSEQAAEPVVTLTDGQLEAIRLNREKAVKLRQERLLKAAQNKAQSSLSQNNWQSNQNLRNDEFPTEEEEFELMSQNQIGLRDSVVNDSNDQIGNNSGVQTENNSSIDSENTSSTQDKSVSNTQNESDSNIQKETDVTIQNEVSLNSQNEAHLYCRSETNQNLATQNLNDVSEKDTDDGYPTNKDDHQTESGEKEDGDINSEKVLNEDIADEVDINILQQEKSRFDDDCGDDSTKTATLQKIVDSQENLTNSISDDTQENTEIENEEAMDCD